MFICIYRYPNLVTFDFYLNISFRQLTLAKGDKQPVPYNI